VGTAALFAGIAAILAPLLTYLIAAAKAQAERELALLKVKQETDAALALREEKEEEKARELAASERERVEKERRRIDEMVGGYYELLRDDWQALVERVNENDATIDALRKECKTNATTIEGLQKEVDRLTDENTDLKRRLSVYETDLDGIKAHGG
jgi:chromosome segregation ATPase